MKHTIIIWYSGLKHNTPCVCVCGSAHSGWQWPKQPIPPKSDQYPTLTYITHSISFHVNFIHYFSLYANVQKVKETTKFVDVYLDPRNDAIVGTYSIFT